MLKADGFDAALIGVEFRHGSPDRLVYSFEKAAAVLVGQGMDEEEAMEYLEFNCVGAYVGPDTPVWVCERTMEEVEEGEDHDV